MCKGRYFSVCPLGMGIWMILFGWGGRGASDLVKLDSILCQLLQDVLKKKSQKSINIQLMYYYAHLEWWCWIRTCVSKALQRLKITLSVVTVNPVASVTVVFGVCRYSRLDRMSQVSWVPCGSSGILFEKLSVVMSTIVAYFGAFLKEKKLLEQSWKDVTFELLYAFLCFLAPPRVTPPTKKKTHQRWLKNNFPVPILLWFPSDL